MRKAELYLAFLLIPLDLLAVVASGSLAYQFRLTSSAVEVAPIAFVVPFETYIRYILLAVPLVLLVFAGYGLYSLSILRRRFVEELLRVILATTTVLMFATFLLFFTQVFDLSRLIVVTTWLTTVCLVGLSRLLYRFIRWLIYYYGLATRRVLIIRLTPTTIDLVRTMTVQRLLGYQLIGVVRTSQRGSRYGLASELAIVTKSESLCSIIVERVPDEVVVADHRLTKRVMLELIECCHRRGIAIKYVPDLYEVTTRNAETSSLASVPLVELRRTPLDGWGRIAKRLFDIGFSLLLIVLFLPVMLVVALGIRWHSRIPVLFNDLDDGSPTMRIGQYGQPFHYVKFRTMYPRTHLQRYTKLKHLNIRQGPLVKLKNDPRVTPLGRLLRKTSLDELPELFLVFWGKMSLVGPRPHLPEEVDRYRSHHRRVLDVKPGITGLAQVSGRHTLSFDDEVRLDSYYVENWSPQLDLAILLRTVMVVVGRTYRE